MKKIFIIVILIFPIIFIGQPIIDVPSCTSCIKNEVDIQKGASALGTQNISTGTNSFAVGYKSHALGNYSIAMPALSIAYGERSFALGYNAQSNGIGSIALGTSSKTDTTGTLAIAIGSFVSADAMHSIAIGVGTVEEYLKNPIEESLMIGFDSNIPTFFVGKADGVGTVGKIGIGTTTPSELLEVNGNLKVNNSAILSTASIENLQVNGIANFYNSQVSGVGTLIGYSDQMIIKNNAYGTAEIFLAQDGNIGIGTENPSATLDVNGTVEIGNNLSVNQDVNINNNLAVVGKTITNQLQITNGAGSNNVLTSDENGNAIWSDIASLSQWGLNYADELYNLNGNNVGIGTDNPSVQLEITNQSQYNKINTKMSDSDDREIVFVTKVGNTGSFNGMVQINDFGIFWNDDEGTNGKNGTAAFVLAPHAQEGETGGIRIDHQGDVQIVNLWADKIKVNTEDPFPDYVFDQDYNILSIEDLDAYVQENHHLPNIPDAQTVSEEGLDVGKMIPLLLQKIEELSLYVIDLKKENENMQNRIVELEK